MGCVSGLLAVAVLWLIVLEVRGRDRFARLEAALESQRMLSATLAEMVDGLKREIRNLRRPPEEMPAPPIPPAPVPEAAPRVVMAPPPPPAAVRAPEPEREAPPPVPPPSFLDEARGAVGRLPKPAIDWENLVGVRLFSWMAGIMIAIAAVLFLRYTIQHGWLSAPIRMAIGLLTGTGLLVLCEWKAARRYTVTANALDAAGIAVLFSTIFASHSLWGLLGATPAFLLMALVAAVAVALAIRHDSPFIALLGLVGGFATPALLSTGEDRPIALFGYLLLLNAGLAWVSVSRRWTILIRLALAFTFAYQWIWVFRFLDPGRLPLAFGIFLVFPGIYLLAPLLARRRAAGLAAGDADKGFQQTAALGAGLPLLLAVYMTAAPGFGDHYGLLFGYLLLLGAGLAVFSAVRGPALLHLGGAAATVVVWALWLGRSYKAAAWPEVLAFLCAEVLLYLAAPWVSRRFGGKLTPRDGTFAAPLLLGAFPALILLEPATASPGLTFSVLFLLLLATAAFALVYESGWLHFGAAFFAVAAEAVWTGRHLTPERLLPGLALYAVFSLFYLGVPLAARRLGRRLLPEEAETRGAYLGLTGYVFVLFVATQTDLSLPPWPVFGVLALLVLAAGVAALALRKGRLHAASLILAHVVLFAWMRAAQKEPWPAVALAVDAVLAAFGVAWIWMARRQEDLLRSFAKGAVAGLFAAQILAAASGLLEAPPGLALTLPVQAGLLVALLALAWRFGWPELAPASVVTAFVAVLLNQDDPSWGGLALATVILLIYLAYPLVLGRRAAPMRQPWLAAVLASAAYFFLARWNLEGLGYGGVIGLLPLLQAWALAVLLRQLLALEPPGERDLGRLALIAGAVLAFVTVAIPLQLEKQWITLGWALLAAALAWLYGRIPHRGLLLWTAGLAAAVFVRLSLNPAVLTYHPRAEIPVWNWYLYTYLVAAVALFGAARLLSRTDDRPLAGLPRLSTLLSAAGGVLLFLLLNIEIADFFSKGSTLTFAFLSGRATLAEGLAYTLGWGIFALALLVTGIVARSRGARIAAIVLLVVTVLKGFLYDSRALGGLYRVGSFLGMAICLLLVAWLMQKYVLARTEEEGVGR
ncbi:MAG: DUF2339 domain-containing protein [Thermoanaerobaculia bacterium]